MARDNYFKSEEARAREMAHWFGQPGGNKPKDIRIARTMREFYAWCENVASLDELKEYAKDETKPAARRRFVKALMDCDKVQDFFDLTNQTHGHPQIQIEVADVPKIDIEIIGGENNETK